MYVVATTLDSMPSSVAAAAVTGPIAATTVMRSKSAACSSPTSVAKRCDGGRAGEGDRVDLAVQQAPVELLHDGRAGGIRRRAVRDEIGDGRAAAGEILRDRVVQMIGPDDEHALIDQRSARRQRVADAFGAELRHHDVGLDAAADEPIGRGRTDGADANAAERAEVARTARQRGEEAGDGRRRFEDHPVIAVERRRRAIDGFGIVRRRQAERRRLDRFRAEALERIHQLARLIGRSRDDDALAEERALVEPAQVIAEAGDLADDQDRRFVVAVARGAIGELERACR